MKLLNSKYPSSAEYFIFHAISLLNNVLFGLRNDVSMVLQYFKIGNVQLCFRLTYLIFFFFPVKMSHILMPTHKNEGVYKMLRTTVKITAT